MIVQYNKISPEHRDLVRAINSKAYVSYVRYLLLKRWSYERIKKELMRLGLAWNDQDGFEIYFQEVLFPEIKKYNLQKYYKKYKFGMKDEPLHISKTFGNSEKSRIRFIDLVKKLEITDFFAEEIIEHYGGVTNLPNHPVTGDPVLPKKAPVDLVEMLQNPKRHVIENLLIEGYAPKQIIEFLYQRYDMELTTDEIKVYARSFFNVKRHDVQKAIDTLQEEKDQLNQHLIEIKRRPAADFSVGERFEALSAINQKIEKLSEMITRLTSVHTGSSYGAALIETTDMREMFQDVMMRAHRRFRDMDERTEDEVVSNLNTIVSMMSKASDKILSIDDVLNQTANKSINEEMLDVLMPTLDRIEQEEREHMYAYKEATSKKSSKEEDDDGEILGFD